MANLTQQVRDLKQEVDRLKRELQKSQSTAMQERISNLETRITERYRISEAFLFGERITGTTDASAGTESTHTHNLGRKPSVVFITPKSNGTVYLTSKSNADIKVKGSDSSLDFVAYLLI